MKKQKNAGITLIALVITIIVLLILAGVTIATLTGENGILTRASDASEQTKEANAEEQVKLAVAASIGTDGNINNTELKKNLDQIEGVEDVPEIITDASYPLTVVVDGHGVAINKNGSTANLITLEQAKDESMLVKSENSILKVQDGTVTIPGGFKVAEDSAENVEGGIVIENSDKNQFVWIPVTESDYKREKTYVGEIFSESAYTDKDYLPDGIQPDLNGETMEERIGAINEKAETTVVVNTGGFYIARFEAGQEETETLVSKKGATVWVNISREEAKERAKNVINTSHAKTALCSGIQWDVVMAFIDGKPDGGTPSQPFDVRTASESRHLGGDVFECSGANEADKVCNIYDLEGNSLEVVAEKAYAQSSRIVEILRGGSTDVPLEASARLTPLGNILASFRVVLYVLN